MGVATGEHRKYGSFSILPGLEEKHGSHRPDFGPRLEVLEQAEEKRRDEAVRAS
jgi:hypothetical protein